MISQRRFEKSPGWLDWCQRPSVPNYVPPIGAVDAHCHVFGPQHEFPFSNLRKYTPCDASKQQLFGLRDFLGFSRNVIVQATCHGTDNSAVLDAIQSSNGLARGVASVAVDVSDAELGHLHNGGIRALRFNFVKRLVDPVSPHELLELAHRVKRFGWHIVVYFEASDLDELFDFITEIPVPVVIDHIGRPNLPDGVTAPRFQKFLSLFELGHIYTKVSCPERLSLSGPPEYSDFVPFARTVIEAAPSRVLWGTDWPHPNLKSHMPDDGWLVDLIPEIAPNPDDRAQLLIDNPMRLYWPEEMP